MIFTFQALVLWSSHLLPFEVGWGGASGMDVVRGWNVLNCPLPVVPKRLSKLIDLDPVMYSPAGGLQSGSLQSGGLQISGHQN